MTEDNQNTRENLYATVLKEKINSHIAHIAVIGLGYVGLPLAVEKAKVGFNVIGIDKNKQRVEQINQGINYIGDVKDEELTQLVSQNKIRATDNYEILKEVDIIVICVPTPLTKNRDPDISYIQAATKEIAKSLRKGQLVTLESTTYPGTTEEIILPQLQASGLQVGIDFFLAFSPERVDPGNKRFTTKNTSKVVGGVTPTCLDIACCFYGNTIKQVVPVSSPAVGEMTKVFENTYRAVNIALVNELMFLCDKMNINVWEVIDAAATKPFGIQTFYPGPGVGGHCIPIDPFYLTWKAREYNFYTRFIEVAGQINIEASYYTVEKVRQALNSLEKSLKGSRILVLGVAYKKDIDDLRESPALTVIKLLKQDQAVVVYIDQNIPSIAATEEFPYALQSLQLTKEELRQADCVLILTDHTDVDYQWVVEHARLIVDTRNATKNILTGKEKIIKI